MSLRRTFRFCTSLLLSAAGLVALSGCPASTPKSESPEKPASDSPATKASASAASTANTQARSDEQAPAKSKPSSKSHFAVDFAQQLEFPAAKATPPAPRTFTPDDRYANRRAETSPPRTQPPVRDAKASPETEPMVLKAQPERLGQIPAQPKELKPSARPLALSAESNGPDKPPRLSDTAAASARASDPGAPNRPASTAAAESPTRGTGSASGPTRPAPEPVTTSNSAANPIMHPNPLRRDAMPPTPQLRTPNPLLGSQSPAATAETTPPPASVPAHPRTRKHNGEKFNPIKENGPIFEGWTKPRLALVITGRQEGYLEPCGCAGLDRMKGGISRRSSMLKTLRDQGWPLVTVDVGGLSKGFGLQAVQKFHISVDAYRQMGYDAIGLGASDLQFSTGDLISVTASQSKQASPFVCANVAMGVFDPALLQSYRVIQVGNIRVGITAVLGQLYQKDVRNAELVMASAETKLAEVFPKLQKEADYFILLAYATIDESTALAEKFSKFNIVVTAGGAPEPPDRPSEIKGTHALLVQVGEKGMNAIVIGLYDDPDPKKQVRYQRVPLDSRFVNAISMKQLMGMYQDQIKALGFEGLGLRAVPYPKADVLGKFVGSEKCATCHEESYKVWKRSGHSQALATLEKADPPRQFDPECLSCHVVGWNGQGFFPYDSGYASRDKTPHLSDVGCESCHGPGEKHVVAEAGGDLELQKKLQKAMVVTRAEAENHTCRTCHDLDNSPEFDFKTYWPLIEHKEKDK